MAKQRITLKERRQLWGVVAEGLHHCSACANNIPGRLRLVCGVLDDLGVIPSEGFLWAVKEATQAAERASHLVNASALKLLQDATAGRGACSSGIELIGSDVPLAEAMSSKLLSAGDKHGE
jgi:hypothetical protein